MKAKNVITLVKKDLRMSRWVVGVSLAIWASPIVLGAVVVTVRTICYDKPLQPELILGLGSWSFYLAYLVIPAVVGYVLTAEGTDRSAGFLAYMPFSRIESLAAKVISVIMTTMLFVWLNLLLAAIALVLKPSNNPFDVPEATVFLLIFLSVLVAIFGSTWMTAICLRSAAIAMVVGLAVPLSLYTYQLAYIGGDLRRIFVPWSLGLGAVFFVVGLVGFMKRKLEA